MIDQNQLKLTKLTEKVTANDIYRIDRNCQIVAYKKKSKIDHE